MDINIRKLIGYIFLCAGFICILFAFYSMYEAFTNAAKPPELFKLNSLTFMVNAAQAQGPTEVTMPLDAQMQKLINLFLYYMYMFFVLAAGSRIGALGIELTREIKAVVKQE